MTQYEWKVTGWKAAAIWWLLLCGLFIPWFVGVVALVGWIA